MLLFFTSDEPINPDIPEMESAYVASKTEGKTSADEPVELETKKGLFNDKKAEKLKDVAAAEFQAQKEQEGKDAAKKKRTTRPM
jgi:hypothetical protein